MFQLKIHNIITWAKSFLPCNTRVVSGSGSWEKDSFGYGALFCPPQVVSCLPALFITCLCPMSPTQPLNGRELFYFLGWSFALHLFSLEAWSLCEWVPRVQTVAWCLEDMCGVQLGPMLLSMHMVMDPHSSVVGLVLFGTKMVTPAVS